MIRWFGQAAIFGAIVLLISAPHPAFRLAVFPLLYLAYRARARFQSSLNSFSKTGVTLLSLAVALLIAIRFGQALHQLMKPIGFIEDIAQVYQTAIRGLFLHLENPYSHANDPYPVPSPEGERLFSGLKYPPLQLFTYAPTVLLWGLHGIYLFHLPLYFATMALIYRFLVRISKQHALTGCLFFLAADYLHVLSFHNGTNDLLPTFLLTLSLLALRAGNETRSGIALGFSLLAKQLPAGFFLIPFFAQKKFRAAMIALTLGAIGCLPFFIADPAAFFDNAILFNLIRPARDSSLLLGAPRIVQSVLSLGGILVFVGLSFRGLTKRLWSLSECFTLGVVGLFVILVTAKMSPVHYFMWVTPILILWLLEPCEDSTR